MMLPVVVTLLRPVQCASRVTMLRYAIAVETEKAGTELQVSIMAQMIQLVTAARMHRMADSVAVIEKQQGRE